MWSDPPSVIHTGDYLGLLLIAPLDPSVTRSATLHVILEDAQRVLLEGDGSQGGGRRIRVEVSADGYKWVSVTPSLPPPEPTCVYTGSLLSFRVFSGDKGKEI